MHGRLHAASRALDWLRRRGIRPAWTAGAADRARAVEDDLFAAYPREWPRLLPVAALELAFHVLAIAEVFLVLSLISGRPPSLLEAFLFESTNRVVGAAFKFIPLRMGVDEAGSGLLAGLLAFGAATGVTLALVRKGRMLVWTSLGIAALAGRGLAVRRETPPTAVASPHAAVVVMARSPDGGQARRRGWPAPWSAKRIAGSCTPRSSRTRWRAAGPSPEAALRVACTPDGGAAGLAALGVRRGELLPQRGADLGARERNAFTDLFAAGFGKVALVGSDLPTLPPGHVRQALEQAAPGTAVLGPAEDGGYYLLALAAPAPGAPLPDCSAASAGARRRRSTTRSPRPAGPACSWRSSRPGATSTTPRGWPGCAPISQRPPARARAPATARVLDELFP